MKNFNRFMGQTMILLVGVLLLYLFMTINRTETGFIESLFLFGGSALLTIYLKSIKNDE